MEFNNLIRSLIVQVYYEPFLTFFSYERLPSLMQTTGIALLTLLVPFGVGILGGFFSKKESSAVYYELDLNVIISTVIPFKKLIYAVGLVFFPAFFWETAGSATGLVALRLGILILWAIGICLLVFILKGIFDWIRGGEYTLRFEYLRENKPTKPKIWDSIFRAEDETSRYKEKFISIFYEQVHDLIVREELDRASDHLNCFNKASYKYISEARVLDKIVYPVFEIHHMTEHLFKTESGRDFEDTLRGCMRKIVIACLKHGNTILNVPLLLEQLSKFVEDKITSEHGEQYIRNFLLVIADAFFEHLPSSIDYNIWTEDFPPLWKIKTDRILDECEENKMPRIWLDCFLPWAQKRIGEHHSKKIEVEDMQLDEFVRELFVDVSPVFWATILTFALLPCQDVEEKIKILIEKDLQFGFSFKSCDIPEDEQKKNAIKLALYVNQFGDTFFRDNLQKYLEELKKISYEEGTLEKDRKEQLKEIFSEMLSFRIREGL